jgi:phospholipase C
MPAESTAQDAGSDAACSQLHRSVSQWQGNEACGPDLTALLEMVPLGHHQLAVRRRFSTPDEVWRIHDGGLIDPVPTQVARIGAPLTVSGQTTIGLAFLSGPTPRLLSYDPRAPQWTLNPTLESPVMWDSVLGAAQLGSWPQGAFPSNDGEPWNQHFTGLEDDHLFDRTLGDGSWRIWRFVPPADPNGMVGIELVANLTGPARDAFRRGHRLVHLGPGRLLEWAPVAGGVPDAGGCAGARFNVWSYDLDPGSAPHDAFADQPVSWGCWQDIGAGHDILADESNLFVWTREEGRLRSYALDPTAADPLAALGAPIGDLTSSRLASRDWLPPTRAPGIEHLVVILQNGRSFDAYFGTHCTGATDENGQPPACGQGQACCAAMPASIPGAAACAPIDPATDTHKPKAADWCVRSKINGGLMDRFAMDSSAQNCADPLDFACADPAAAAMTDYYTMADAGALADNFFQTVAYRDGGDPGTDSWDPVLENVFYLAGARYMNPLLSQDTPSLTKELPRSQVSWALYAGNNYLKGAVEQGTTIYYDPDWYPQRALEGHELESDIALGQLPAVAIVAPDDTDTARSEAPGHPFDQAIAYVSGLATTIRSSPIYGSNTLVLLAYLTAGGYYDHVMPPTRPELTTDGSSDNKVYAGYVYYGPRVPLIAFPPFAISGGVSHVQLEMSSITQFIEWNWLHGATLKHDTDGNDPRHYRDMVVNNLGSLLDPAAAGAAVPITRE